MFFLEFLNRRVEMKSFLFFLNRRDTVNEECEFLQ